MRVSCGEDGVVEIGMTTHVATAASAVRIVSCGDGRLRPSRQAQRAVISDAAYSRGDVAGHSTALIVPSGSRSSVGA